jgi:hypothetical protein
MNPPLLQGKRLGSPCSADLVKKSRTEHENGITAFPPCSDVRTFQKTLVSEEDIDALIDTVMPIVSTITQAEKGRGVNLAGRKGVAPSSTSSFNRLRPTSCDMWEDTMQREVDDSVSTEETIASLSPSLEGPVDTTTDSEVQWRCSEAFSAFSHPSPSGGSVPAIGKTPQMIQPPQFVMVPYPFTDIQVAVLADFVTGEVKVLQSITSSPKYKGFSFEVNLQPLGSHISD